MRASQHGRGWKDAGPHRDRSRKGLQIAAAVACGILLLTLGLMVGLAIRPTPAERGGIDTSVHDSQVGPVETAGPVGSAARPEGPGASRSVTRGGSDTRPIADDPAPRRTGQQAEPRKDAPSVESSTRQEPRVNPPPGREKGKPEDGPKAAVSKRIEEPGQKRPPDGRPHPEGDGKAAEAQPAREPAGPRPAEWTFGEPRIEPAPPLEPRVGMVRCRIPVSGPGGPLAYRYRLQPQNPDGHPAFRSDRFRWERDAYFTEWTDVTLPAGEGRIEFRIPIESFPAGKYRLIVEGIVRFVGYRTATTFEILSRSVEECAKIAAEIAARIDSSAAGSKAEVFFVVSSGEEGAGVWIREQFPAALAKTKLHARGSLRLGVAAMGPSSRIVLEPSEDLEKFREALVQAFSGEAAWRLNPFPAIRIAAERFQGRGTRRFIVLVTERWFDDDDGLEETVAALKAGKVTFLSVTPEVAYQDHWYRSPGLGRPRDDPFGPESAYFEFPHRWFFTQIPYGWNPVFQLVVADTTLTVPSGRPLYAVARLAFETGGVNLLAPCGGGPTFCRLMRCPLCNGAHKECDPVYDDFVLRKTAPRLERREVIARGMIKDRLWRAVYAAWNTAHEVEVVTSPPPAALYRKVELPPHLGGKVRLPGTPDLGEVRRRHSSVRERAAKISAAVRNLDAAVASARRALTRRRSRTEIDRRALATAETLAAFLAVARMNLLQMNAMTQQRNLRGAQAAAVPRYVFCHGGAPLEEAAIYGEEELRPEWRAMCRRIDRVIRANRGTPWEMLVRRMVIQDWVKAAPLKVERGRPSPDRQKERRQKTPRSQDNRSSRDDEGSQATGDGRAGFSRPARPGLRGSGRSGGVRSTGR